MSKPVSEHQEDNQLQGMNSSANAKSAGGNENPLHQHKSYVEHLARARDAEAAEHSLSVWQTVKENPKVFIYVLMAQIGPFMYGFDAIAFSVCLSMVPFQQHFGQHVGGTSYIIPAYWQSLWNALTQVATMIGAMFTGILLDRLGRRATLFIGAAISMIGVAVAYISASPGVFLAGKMVNGVALGVMTTAGVTYISEITPIRMRGICLSALIFSTNLGCLIAAVIAFPRTSLMTTNSYKGLFATEWAWPAIMILVVFFAPESPYHLARTGKYDQAKHMLKRLRNKRCDIDAAMDEIAVIIEEERARSVEKSHVRGCFKNTNWRRTRIILYMNGVSQCIGASFVNNAPYFLIQAGMDSSDSVMIVEIGFALGIITSILAWLFMDTVGRRPVLFAGLGTAMVLYLAMGIAGCFKSHKADWAVGILLMLVICTNGPVTGASTSIAGEVSQARLRGQSQAIGFMFNYFFSTVWQVVIPYMFNADEGNLGGKMGWIFFATSVIGLVVLFFEVPETNNRSFGQLDEMFDHKVPTRQFKNYSTSGLTME